MTKNVPLRNDTAKVKDVCTLLAHMMAISNHADHALFSIVDGKGNWYKNKTKTNFNPTAHLIQILYYWVQVGTV